MTRKPSLVILPRQSLYKDQLSICNREILSRCFPEICVCVSAPDWSNTRSLNLALYVWERQNLFAICSYETRKHVFFLSVASVVVFTT